LHKYLTHKNIQILFISLTALVAIIYPLVTNHIWEDFYITFRHSKNLVDGYGLVYQPGERVHGFTSAINTLLPAFFYWITNNSFDLTIWLYRLTSIAALIYGGFFLLRKIQKIHPDNFITPLLFALLFTFQAKTIMFTTNGQEAGFMILFLLPSLFFAYEGFETNWKWAGICWAGLIYTRPDGVIYIALLSIATVTFGHSSLKSKADMTALFRTAIVCAVLYLPWFIFVWIYYGSPIPHTISAKAGLGGDFLSDIIHSLQAIISFNPTVGVLALEPTYYHFGGWPYWIKIYAFISWIISSIYWLIPGNDRLGRFVSFIYTMLIFYLSFLQFRAAVYPWYFPPAEILSIFILSSAIYHLPKKLSMFSLTSTYLLGISLLLAATNIFFMTLNQISIQQNIIENGNRKQIGLWLNKNKQDGDSVFLEPLGYIGYYSNAKMLDWPGLVSPEVATIKKDKKGHPYPRIIKQLKPDWVILRPQEIPPLQATDWFLDKYKAVKVFNVKDRLDQYEYIPGRNYLDFDSIFYIFKKI